MQILHLSPYLESMYEHLPERGFSWSTTLPAADGRCSSCTFPSCFYPSSSLQMPSTACARSTCSGDSLSKIAPKFSWSNSERLRCQQRLWRPRRPGMFAPSLLHRGLTGAFWAGCLSRSPFACKSLRLTHQNSLPRTVRRIFWTPALCVGILLRNEMKRKR